MIRLLLLMALLVNVTYANSEKYFIQFGSFKNLQGLERSIDKLPLSLRSHVVIVHSNAWYIPFAYYTSNKQALVAKLSSYKHYFPDAHIAHSAYMLKHPLVKNYNARKKKKIAPIQRQIQRPKITYAPQEVYQNVGIRPAANAVVNTYQVRPLGKKIITQKVILKEVESNDVFSNIQPKRYKNFSKHMLGGQHYYLAYKKTENNPNLLIKVIFGNHEVTYQPVIGDMKMTKANYLIEDKKLYMFSDTFTRNGSFSKLDEHRENHFLVSSWANGKKLNTLRYYYKMNEAKKYLGIDSSNGLAEILSEGNYDDFFLEE